MINKDRLIALTQKVISINSENPPGREKELARFIEKDMRSLGLDVKTYSYAQNRPNIVATLKGSLPRRQARSQALLLTPHFDTVPIGKGWKFDPLGGEVKGGKLYGRGATDDKGNLASCMEVMRSLAEDKFRPQKDVIMAATVDEETGSHYGIIPLLEKGVLRPGCGCILDSTEFDAIVAQKGLIHFRVLVRGVKAHGAYNWRGVSAIEQAAKIIERLKRMKFKAPRHPLLHAPTINIGTIQGGDKVNMVADVCEFSVDFRFMPGMNGKEMLKKIRREISQVTKKFSVEIDDFQQPYEIDKKHPFVKAYMDVLKKMKIKAGLKGSEGATVITFFKKHKIPAFATGFGAHETAHTTDEYIFVRSLYKGTQALERYVKAYDEL